MTGLVTWWCELFGYAGGCYGLSLDEMVIVFGSALAASMIGVVAMAKLAAKL